MFAIVAFVHLGAEVEVGDEFGADHELVRLRPDLFSQTKPKKVKEAP